MENQIVPESGSSMKFSGSHQQPPVFGPPTNSKIFVGSLAWETTSETLQSYFEQFGEIREAVVITDKHTGRSKGYGFVTFADAEAAYRACANPNPVIDQRRTNCNLASFGRSAPYLPYGNQRPLVPVMGSPHSVRRPYIGNPMYQLPVPYAYYPGLPFPMYGYTPYRPEYFYPQMYGVPRTATPKDPSVVQHGRPIVGETMRGDASGMTQVNQTDPPQFNTENGSEQMTS